MTQKFINLFLIVFFITVFTNLLPLEACETVDKRQFPDPATQQGHVAFADFDPELVSTDVEEAVTGKVTMTILNDGSIRVIGQCNTGFINPNPDFYSFRIVPRPFCPPYIRRLDLTPKLKYFINVPGTSAFQADFNTFTLDEIIGSFVIVKMGGTIIGAGEIKRVGINPNE